MTDRPAQSARVCNDCGCQLGDKPKTYRLCVKCYLGRRLAGQMDFTGLHWNDNPAPPAPPERPGEAVWTEKEIAMAKERADSYRDIFPGTPADVALPPRWERFLRQFVGVHAAPELARTLAEHDAERERDHWKEARGRSQAKGEMLLEDLRKAERERDELRVLLVRWVKEDQRGPDDSHPLFDSELWLSEHAIGDGKPAPKV